MSTVIVVGVQWGDEGKGKVVDILARDADIIVRFGGGNNAGHTLLVGEQKTVLEELRASPDIISARLLKL